MQVLTWWCKNAATHGCDGIICDGAVRSGKTFSMSLSFILWAFAHYNQCDFAMCGKTIASLKRNVITPLIKTLTSLGFDCIEKTSRNYLDIAYTDTHNRFYYFGGKDESSASLIQGITLAGVLLDEVALMPRSFVEQALARCSVKGSKFWFNCNPENPFHWFYLEWIQKYKQKNIVYLHFRMEDNPSLSKVIRKRYQSLYSGAFYDRFVLGKWVAADGLVYSMFSQQKHVTSSLPDAFDKYYISCDYGTVNPASFGLWGQSKGRWYRITEYYYDSKIAKEHKTDEEYYLELVKLAGKRTIMAVIVDPSAKSFIECIKRHGRFTVIPASNDVLAGIQQVAEMLKKEQLLIHQSCTDSIREFSLYSWESDESRDQPKKKNDHAMDDIRYFVSTITIKKDEQFFVCSTTRNTYKGG